ncbi:MAG: TlpA family protein disulfide reductase [Thermoplasmata archaeon]|nr:TlpA family protein disulfide reductase [Thermoplasmata archaeon]
MNKRVRNIGMILLLTIISVPLSGCISGNKENSKMDSSLDFTLKDINGKTFNLSDFLGKVILLNFMTTDCPYCSLEMRELEKVRETTGDDVIIISIDADKSDTNREIKNTYSKYINKWIFALDTYKEDVSDKYMVYGVPKNVIINTQGKVSYSNPGLTSKDILLNEINKAKI